MDRNHVLIVDDDRLVLEMMADTLREAGYLTSTFQDARAALRALETERPVVIVSDYTMPRMDGVTFLAKARARAPHATRILCTGAKDFDMALGAVNSGEVYRIVRKPWQPQDLVDTIADAAETGLLRAEYERMGLELSRRNARLLEANEELEELVRRRTENMLEGLVAALDCRDTDTQWHSRRVSRYARRLAVQLGVRDPELTVVEHGALLHDVGKIGVRDEVLRKPGALSAGEWEDMRKHAALGWSLLHSVEYLRAAATIVLQHHERWDGTGYPACLAGEDISLGARIFHVVDTLDAMTSDRPYRKARPFSVARREIQALAGTQFDPRVVQAFLEVELTEWERIRVDVETVAILSAELMADPSDAVRSPAADAGPALEREQWAKKRLGEILLELRVINRQQLDTALEYQRWHRCKLGVALIELGFASEDQVLTTVARKLGYDRIRLGALQRTPVVEAALRLVPEELASAKGVVPIACDRTTLTVALRDPTNLTLVDELAFRTGRRVRVAIAGEREIAQTVARLYAGRADAELDVGAGGDEKVEVVPLADASSAYRPG